MRILPAVLIVACLLTGLLLAGCGGEGTGITNLPPEFVGLWGAAAYDAGGDPAGVGMFEVQTDGTIVLESATAFGAAVTAQVGTVVGRIENSGGAFSITVPGDDVVTRITGNLDTDNTGSATWIAGVSRGSVELWRASGSGTFTLDVTISGPATGTGTITVDAARAISGSVMVNGLTQPVEGVVTGSGHIIAGWGNSSGDDPFALIEGDVTGTGASGIWTLEDGTDGTWTATFE